MVETILKCTFCLWRMRVTVCVGFPFSKPNTVVHKQSFYRVVDKSVSQRTAAAHAPVTKRGL